MGRDLAEDAARWLNEQGAAMESALAELVEINSFTENVEGGTKVGQLLRERFLEVDALNVEVRPSARFAPHLVFEAQGAKGKAPIALLGHLDTVFPPGTFEGYRTDGELRRGPGVLDMKGGLVVVLWALKALAATAGLASVAPLKLVIVSDEEVGSPEGQGIIKNAIAGATSALVFESGRKGDAIITRRKGTGGMTAIAHGKAAHAGNNHKEGANAIWALARFIEKVQMLTDYDRGLTVNVGKISGGQGKNTVPDRAEALLDLRFVTRADGEMLVRAVETAAQQASDGVPGTHIELTGGIARHPLERSPESALLMNAYGQAARAAGLGDVEAALIGGGSDASTSSAMGIASIDGLGPRGIGFHTKDEQIEVKTLVQKAQALARFLVSR